MGPALKLRYQIGYALHSSRSFSGDQQSNEIHEGETSGMRISVRSARYVVSSSTKPKERLLIVQEATRHIIPGKKSGKFWFNRLLEKDVQPRLQHI